MISRCDLCWHQRNVTWSNMHKENGPTDKSSNWNLFILYLWINIKYQKQVNHSFIFPLFSSLILLWLILRYIILCRYENVNLQSFSPILKCFWSSVDWPTSPPVSRAAQSMPCRACWAFAGQQPASIWNSAALNHHSNSTLVFRSNLISDTLSQSDNSHTAVQTVHFWLTSVQQLLGEEFRDILT